VEEIDWREKCGIIGSFFKGSLCGFNEEWSVEFIFIAFLKLLDLK